MSTTEQPNALRLADELAAWEFYSSGLCWKAAAELRRQHARLTQAEDLLRRAVVYCSQDATMMADLSRHAPLPPDAQAKHDSTEYDSEKLVLEIPEWLKEQR